MNHDLHRRGFLSTTLLSAGAAGLLTSNSAGAVEEVTARPLGVIAPGSTILFQGDSITDAGRKRNRSAANDQPALGGGYALLSAAQLITNAPDANLSVYNRGISGNKVHQLAARWQQDCLDLKPDVLSILVGVNDIWHALNGKYDGTVETYRNDYRQLLRAHAHGEYPEVKIVICEPFVLKTGAVTDKWFPEFDGFREAARQLAAELADVWVPFQSMFDEAVKLGIPNYWAGDGVHPTAAGSAMMAHAWVRAATAS